MWCGEREDRSFLFSRNWAPPANWSALPMTSNAGQRQRFQMCFNSENKHNELAVYLPCSGKANGTTPSAVSAVSTNVFMSYWGNVFKVLFATLRASLLEMMLESSLSDLREAQGVALPFCPSLVRLLRLLQDFLFTEGTDNHTLWSEKVYHISNIKHRYR